MIAVKRIIIALIAGLVFAFVAPKMALAQGPVLDLSMDFNSGSTVLTVDSGVEFSFHITYRCASALNDCTNVVITDTLPISLTFITTVSPPSHVQSVNFDAGTNTVVFNFIDPLPAGSTGLLEIKAKFPAGTLPGTQVVDNATSSTSGGVLISNPVTVVAQGQFEMTANKTVTGAASTAVIGNDFLTTYQLQVCSPDSAGGVRLTNPEFSDPLPPKAVYVSSNPAGVYNAALHTVTWTYASNGGTLPDVIDVGGCYTIDMVVKFPPDGRDGILGNSDDPIIGETITNTVTITGTPEDGTPQVVLSPPGPVSFNLKEPYFSDSFSKSSSSPSSYTGRGTEELAGGPVRYDLNYNNSGTITATNVIITDTVPVSHSIVSVDVTAGASAFYEQNNSGTWVAFPGNPYAVATTVTITDLGVAGDSITGLRWDIGDVPYGTSWSAGFDTTLDPLLTAGTTLTNCADYGGTWDNNGTPTSVSGTSCADVTIINQRAIPRPAKSMPAGPFNPGEVFTVTLVASNDTVAHNPVKAPIILADLMPPGLEIVVSDAASPDGWRAAVTTDTWYSLINADGAAVPTATITLSGTQQLAKWEWGAPYQQLPGHFTEVEFTVKVEEGTPPGTLNNRAYLMWGNTTVNPLVCSGNQVYTDTLDLNGNGNFTETGCQTNPQPVNISVFLSMDSEKFVWGELDSGWNKLGWTVPGGYVDWQMIITNTSNVTTSNIVVYDILPYIGDTGVIATWENRGTQWRPNMQAPVTAPPGVPLTIYYSQSQNACRTDIVPSGPAGCVNDWTTTFPVNDPTSVQALKLDFCDSGGTCLDLAPETNTGTGGVVTFTWHMVAPNLAPQNQIAWNSFGFTASGGGKQLLPTEPIRVGVQLTSTVTPFNLGDYVWLDVAGQQNDGIQQPEEPGINGARVELYDQATGNLLDYRYTGPDQFGRPGYYLFTNLTLPNYYLRFYPPVTYPLTITPTLANQGGNDALDSDGETSGIDATYGAYSQTTTINLITDTLTWDMGYYVPTDYGDAPQDNVTWKYPVVAATQPISPAMAGRHIISPTMYLGNGVDAELDGQQTLTALGDDTTLAPDDEDGVTFSDYLGTVAQPTGIMFIGENNTLTISATSPFTTAYLNAWIDFNGDGDWDDAGEQIASDQAWSGSKPLTVTVPSTAISGTTYARFRYSTQQGLTPSLTAPDGEVEDYRVILINPPVKSIVSTNDADTFATNVSIGEKVRFRLKTPIPEGTLTNFSITDNLPTGMQFISGSETAVLTGTNVTSTSFTVTGGPFGDGTNPVFNFGTVTNGDTDPDVEYVVVEFDAQVLNNGTNVNGTTLNNNFTVNYDTVNRTSNTVTVDIVEPVLHIGKTYVTPNACGATLLVENFNDGSAQNWSGGGGWNIVNGTYQRSVNYSERFYNVTTWTDYSYSLMVRPDTNSSNFSVYFRRTNASNYYKLVWDNASANPLQLIRREGGSNIIQQINRSFTPGHWYHIEMKGMGNAIQVFIDGELIFTDSSSVLTGGQVGIRTESGGGLREFDDVLVTKMDNMGCYIGANQLITYTLFISNQWEVPGYDLVITDSLPISTSFVSYNFTSSDGASSVKPGQAPTLGDTGVITWGVTQLTNANPFTPISHPAITMTVVAKVDAGVPAGTILPSQVWLGYDNKPGSPGLGFERSFSGGSHSTALRTVPGEFLKAVTFSPPPTATLGSLVTYTLTAPTTPITASLYGVVITDQLQTPRYFIENVSATGGTNPATSFDQATGMITATFDNILAGAQATITVTTRISHAFPSLATDPNGGDTVTNTAVLSHTQNVIVSNVVTTTVHEPRVQISKAAAVAAGNPQAMDYTVTVTNNGDADAFGLTVTDATPGGTTVSNIGQGGTLWPDNRTISWTISSLAVGASQNLTYRLTLTEPIYASNLFTNTAIVTNTSLTSTIPGVRPYVTSTVHTFPLPMGQIGDYVWLDTDYDGTQGSTPSEAGINGAVVNLYNADTGALITTTTTFNNGTNDGYYLFDNLPLGITYTVQLAPSNFTGGGVLVPYVPTQLGQGTPITDSNANPAAMFLGNGYAVTTTLTSAITQDLTLDFGFAPLMSLGNFVWWDYDNNGSFDAGEPPFGGVDVYLYADTDANNVYSTGDTLISTTVTAATGNYTFTNLFPGNYLVVITRTNFITGGVLQDYVPSTFAVSGNSDNNNINHGAPNTLPNVDYATSNVVTLIGNTEPINDGDTDANTNLTLDFGFVVHDLGDLPDGYGTLTASTGARHVISPTLYLGNLVDAEPDGQPSADAAADDTNASTGFPSNGDDEDGVQWTPFVLGGTSTFTVTASSNAGYLNGWIDFNGNGTFDASEHVINGSLLATGANTFNITVPATATLSNIYMRFRYSTQQVLASTGDAPDGEVEDYVTTTLAYDLGDLPDTPYPTLLANSGARHAISATLYLGDRVDAEGDGQPNATATGDDTTTGPTIGTAGADDEDGVTWQPLFLGGTSTLTVTTNSANQGYLNAWIDFDGNGTLTDAGEQVISGALLTAGANTFNITVPATATTGNLYMRFRYSSQATLSPTGDAPDGEVEDYVTTAVHYDLGDLPDGYGTLLASSGARHMILANANPTLGATVDAEGDGQPSAAALGDDAAVTTGFPTNGDDEDGVVWSALELGQTTAFTVTASQATGALNAWIDFNGNGVFDTSEHVISGAALVLGANSFNITVPATSTLGDIYMRFRYSSQTTLSPTGDAPDGEVEDYVTQPVLRDWGDLPEGPYPTTLAQNGARHIILPFGNPTLGAAVDAEVDGQPNATATGDDVALVPDDEDGVQLLTPLVVGRVATFTITATNATDARLMGWMDFNGDGDFADTGELVFNSISLAEGANTLNITVPTVVLSDTINARFRYSTLIISSPTGEVGDGEVEDYQFNPTRLVSLGDFVWYDYNNDGQYQSATESGVNGVSVELYNAGDTAGVSAPVATTATNAAGRYLFRDIPEGGYFVHIPTAAFTVGQPLYGYDSSVPTQANPNTDQNETVDENGIPVSGTADVAGVSSNVITVTVGTEPTGDDVASIDTSTPDTSSNLTLDFGFYPANAGITVVKTVQTSPNVNQATVRYTITVTNSGQLDLYPVALTDTLPAELQYVPGTFSPISPTVISGQTLGWDNIVVSALQPGQSTQVGFDAQITTQITGTYINVVTGTGVYSGGVVTDTGSVPIAVRDPAVDLIKTIVPPGAVNGVITYTINVTNTGASVLDVIPLFDYYAPTYLGFLRSTPAEDQSLVGEIRWFDLTQSFGRNLSPGETFVVTTTFAILQPITQTVNTAVVSGTTDIFVNPAPPITDTAVITNTPTAVSLVSFTAEQSGNDVLLRWTTATELNNRGFYIYRAETADARDAVDVSGFIPATGAGNYTFTDNTVAAGTTYHYWLVDLDNDGLYTWHAPVEITISDGGNTTGLTNKLYLPLLLK